MSGKEENGLDSVGHTNAGDLWLSADANEEMSYCIKDEDAELVKRRIRRRRIFLHLFKGIH